MTYFSILGGYISLIGEADYDSGPFNITIPAGETLAVFNIPINDDDLIEGNENFTLSINASLLPSNVVIVNPVQIKVTIFDDDCELKNMHVCENI